MNILFHILHKQDFHHRFLLKIKYVKHIPKTLLILLIHQYIFQNQIYINLNLYKLELMLFCSFFQICSFIVHYLLTMTDTNAPYKHRHQHTYAISCQLPLSAFRSGSLLTRLTVMGGYPFRCLNTRLK